MSHSHFCEENRHHGTTLPPPTQNANEYGPSPPKMPMISAYCLLPNADDCILIFHRRSARPSAPTLRLFVFVLLQFVVRPLVIHSMLFPPFVLLLAPIPLAFSIWPIVLAEPVFALDHLSLQDRATDEKHSSASTSPSLLSSVALTKCQSDYLSALIHRCMIRGVPTAMEGRICFADGKNGAEGGGGLRKS